MAALAANKKRLRDVTELQYKSQLRDFATRLGANPRSARVSQVVAYVKALDSSWTRRRAVSALRVLYRHLGRVDVADALLAGGFGRPSRLDFKSVARRLNQRGWTVGSLGALSWQHVLEALAEAGPCVVHGRRLSLNATARLDLRRLLCRRFPTSSALLGSRGRSERIFRAADLEGLRRRE